MSVDKPSGPVNPVRRYNAERRQAGARETRERIAQAARDLFGARGYGATSMAQLARAANVSPQTVYAVFGSKLAILNALLHTIELEAEQPLLLSEVRRTRGDARGQIALFAGFLRQLFERGADVLAILRGAGAVDLDLAATWREGEQRRRDGLAAAVAEWEASGALVAGLASGEALDIAWTLAGPDVYRLLVSECGWSPDRYQQWLADSLTSLLLRPLG
jgi:AcrR family transcriptional regulator